MSLADDLNKLRDELDSGQIDSRQYDEARAQAIQAADASSTGQSSRIDATVPTSAGPPVVPIKTIMTLQIVGALVFAGMWIKVTLGHAPILFVFAVPLAELLALPVFFKMYRKALAKQASENSRDGKL